MAACTCIRLFLVVLCFSYLICKNNAIPFTRSRNLNMMQKPQRSEIPKWVLLGNFEKGLKMESIRRMEIEVNDYPGSGANNRHTPRTQLGRGCIDC